MKTSTLTQFNSFISRLDTAAADQAASLRQAEAFVERCREDYQALQTRRKGLEKLLEKEAEEIRAAAAKAEQKLMDESALHSHMRRQRQEGM
jgi:flagellar FliJ protein